MLTFLTFSVFMLSLYSIAMVATLIAASTWYQTPKLGIWLEKTYTDFGSWLPDSLSRAGDDVPVWMITFLFSSLVFSALSIARTKQYRAQLVAKHTTSILARIFNLPKSGTIETVVSALKEELEALAREESSDMLHMSNIIDELSMMQARLYPLDNMQERMSKLQDKIAEAEQALAHKGPELKAFRSELARALDNYQLFEDQYGELASRLSDLDELEKEFDLILAKFDDSGVEGIIADLKSLHTEITKTGELSKTLMDNPLGSGYGLEDTIIGLRAELEKLPDPDTIQEHLEKIKEIEDGVSTANAAIGNPEKLVQRISALKEAVETLVQIDSTIWSHDDVGLIDFLVELTLRLEQADQTDLEEQVDIIKEIEDDLQKAIDAIVSAAARLQTPPSSSPDGE